jgi:hypothetical protein
MEHPLGPKKHIGKDDLKDELPNETQGKASEHIRQKEGGPKEPRPMGDTVYQEG